MALLGKRKGAFGIAYQLLNNKDTAAALPVYRIPCESANIEASPVTYERVSSLTADPIGREQSGFEYSWSFSGAELDMETVGYLVWLWLHSEDGLSAVHTMPDTGADIPYSSGYLTVFKDHGGIIDDIGVGDNVTQRLAGCRIDTLTIDQPHKGYAKVSASGVGMAMDYISDVLSRASFANPAMGYHHLMAATTISGIAFAADEGAASDFANGLVEAKAVKIEFKREQERAGRNYSSNNPTEITEGGRSVTVEVMADLVAGNANLVALMAIAETPNRIHWNIKWNDVADGSSFRVDIPTSQITNSPRGELGTSTDPQEMTFTTEAFRFADANDLINVVVDDNNATPYADRVGV